MPVYGPCPNSMCFEITVTVLSGAMRMNAFGTNSPAGSAASARFATGMWKPTMSAKRRRALEELPAVGGNGDVHAQPSIRPAASWMAALMRW